jgi:glycosyltransferase involved in cell wall biosynthesis
MRIAYVLASWPEPSQTFVRAEIAALREQGVEVGIVAARVGALGGERLPDVVGLGEDAVRFLRGFDHVHGHFADFAVRCAGPLAERAGRPWSLTAHACDLFRQDTAVRPAEWQGLSPRCTTVVTISRFHQRFIADRGVPIRRIAVIPNAVDVSALSARSRPLPTALRSIVAVGRPVAKKGFPDLVHAWAAARARVPGLQLTIVGGAGLVAGEVPGLVLLPMLPHDETLDRMAAADLVAAPCTVAPGGDMDGIPTVLVEAGALRRPVLATRLSGIPDLVADGVNGLLVPPGDVPSLAAALVRLAERPAELARMAAAGPVLAAAHDAGLVAEQLIRTAFLPARMAA